MTLSRSVSTTAAAFVGLASLAPMTARADRNVPVAQTFTGTTCTKWAGSPGLPHLGFDGLLYNQGTGEQPMLVSCPLPVSWSWDNRPQVAVSVNDAHPVHAIECFLRYDSPTGDSAFGGSFATVGTGLQRFALAVDPPEQDWSTKIVCSLPADAPAAGSQWSHIRLYSYSAQRVDDGV